jgi:transmembrane sensor
MRVTIQGEALFSVAPHSGTPFVTQTEHATVRVLGTTFLVRRYAADSATRVMVTDGRVAVGDAILTAGMLGVATDSGAVTVTSGIAPDDYTAWTAGQLVFQNTPVRDMLVELSRAYGVDLHVADTTLGDRRLTWRIAVTQRSLRDVMHSLSVLLDAHYTTSARVITLHPGRAASARPALPRGTSDQEPQYGK